MSDITRSEALKELKEYEEGLDMEYATPFDKAILFAISSLETDEAYQLEYERTTKNDLGVDCISRADALKLNVYAPIAPIVEGEKVHYEQIILTEELKSLPSVTPKIDESTLHKVAKEELQALVKDSMERDNSVLEDIKRIIDDNELEAWEVLKQIKEALIDKHISGKE